MTFTENCQWTVNGYQILRGEDYRSVAKVNSCIYCYLFTNLQGALDVFSLLSLEADSKYSLMYLDDPLPWYLIKVFFIIQLQWQLSESNENWANPTKTEQLQWQLSNCNDNWATLTTTEWLQWQLSNSNDNWVTAVTLSNSNNNWATAVTTEWL